MVAHGAAQELCHSSEHVCHERILRAALLYVNLDFAFNRSVVKERGLFFSELLPGFLRALLRTKHDLVRAYFWSDHEPARTGDVR